MEGIHALVAGDDKGSYMEAVVAYEYLVEATTEKVAVVLSAVVSVIPFLHRLEAAVLHNEHLEVVVYSDSDDSDSCLYKAVVVVEEEVDNEDIHSKDCNLDNDEGGTDDDSSVLVAEEALFVNLEVFVPIREVIPWLKFDGVEASE